MLVDYSKKTPQMQVQTKFPQVDEAPSQQQLLVDNSPGQKMQTIELQSPATMRDQKLLNENQQLPEAPISQLNSRKASVVSEGTAQRQKRVKSLKEQQDAQLLENQKKLTNAIRQRSFWRICNLVVIVFLLFYGAFYIIYYHCFYHGTVAINPSDKVNITITQCGIYIQDIDQAQKINKLSPEVQLAGIALKYKIPGRTRMTPFQHNSFIQLPDASTNDQKNYTFHNMLSESSCSIKIQIFKQVTLQSLYIKCDQCSILYNTKLLKVRNVTIEGNQVSLNGPNTIADNMNVKTLTGKIELQNATLTNSAYLQIEKGNSIFQSYQSFNIQWKHAFPAYCFSAPKFGNDFTFNETGCKMPSKDNVKTYVTDGQYKKKTKAKSHKNDYLLIVQNKSRNADEMLQRFRKSQKDNSTNTDLVDLHKIIRKKRNNKTQVQLNSTELQQEQEALHKEATRLQEFYSHFESHLALGAAEVNKLFPQTCTGSLTLCADDSCSGGPQRKVIIVNKFGDIFANIVPTNSNLINQNTSNLVFNKDYYGKNRDKQYWSMDMQKSIKEQKKLAEDPQNFDPTFLIHFGSRKSLQPNYQHWHVNYNPAYAYIRPWWLSTLSFKLMNSPLYQIDGALNPGFCPYIPGFVLKELYKKYQMFNTLFKKKEEKLVTIAWQHDVKLPTDKLPDVAPAVRFVSKDRTESENWFVMTKTNDTNIEFEPVSLDNSPAAYAAVIISIILAIIIGTVLWVGVLYGINVIYSNVMDQVTNVKRYIQIEDRIDNTGNQLEAENEKEAEANNKDSDNQQDELAEGEDINLFNQLGAVVGEQINPQQESQEKENQNVGEDEGEENKNTKVEFNFNLKDLLLNVFIHTPPISAFIDYLVVLISKKYVNSGKEFYKFIFKKKQASEARQQQPDNDFDDEDEEYFNQNSTERIRGSEMKTLYEKFCYLHGYLEQKLDDPDNINLLKEKGFQIEVLKNSLTLCYTHVALLVDYNPLIKKNDEASGNNENNANNNPGGSEPQPENSLDLFLKNCCHVSKFESDFVEALDFDKAYEEFCFLNHLEKQNISQSELKQKYKIECTFKSQQWVTRIVNQDFIGIEDQADPTTQKQKPKNKKMEQQPQMYYIDKINLQNHLNLLVKKPEKIKSQNELLKATVHLIKVPRWYIQDTMTVIAHLLTIFFLSIPSIGISLMNRVLYAPYSLSPDDHLITEEDFFQNFWIVPIKMLNDTPQIRMLAYIVIIFWIFSFIDLFYYYTYMDFPQENFFLKEKQIKKKKFSKYFQMFFRAVMWLFSLFSIYVLICYFIVVLLWLLLGAIINPTNFLPYATAAATFIVIVSVKSKLFSDIAESGFSKVLSYVQEKEKGSINDMMQKMNEGQIDTGEVDQDMQIQYIYKSKKLQLINDDTSDFFEQIFLFQSDEPSQQINIDNQKQKAARELKRTVCQQASELIHARVGHSFPDYSEEISEVMENILSKDQGKLKHNLKILLMKMGHAHPELAFFDNGNLINLLWIFAFPDQSIESNNKGTFNIDILTYLGRYMIDLINKKLNKAIDPKIVEQIIRCIFFLKKQDYQEILSCTFNIISGAKIPEYADINEFKDVFDLCINLFQNQESGLNYFNVQQIGKGIIQSMGTDEKSQALLEIFEFLQSTYKQYNKSVSARKIKQLVSRLLEDFQPQQQQLSENSNNNNNFINSTSLTLYLCYLRHQLQNLPNDQIMELLRQIKASKIRQFEEIYTGSEAENLIIFKNIAKALQSSFEIFGIFLKSQQRFVINLTQVCAQFYQVNSRIAQGLQILYFTGNHDLLSDEKFGEMESQDVLHVIAEKLQLQPNEFLGLVALIQNRYQMRQHQEIVNLIYLRNKINKKRWDLFTSLLYLCRSDKEEQLHYALKKLGIQQKYLFILLLSKGLVQVSQVPRQFFYELGIKEKEFKDKFEELYISSADNCTQVFVESLKEKFEKQLAKEKANEDGEEDQRDHSMEGGSTTSVICALLSIDDDPSNFIENINQLLHKLANNHNKIQLLTIYDVEFLKKLLKISFFDSQNKHEDLFNLPTDIKEAISSLSFLLNIDQLILEQLVVFLIIRKPDKIKYAIKKLGIKKLQKKHAHIKWQPLLEYQMSQIEDFKISQKYINNNIKDFFHTSFSSDLYLKILLQYQGQLKLSTVQELVSLICGEDEDTYGTIYQKVHPFILYIKSMLDTNNQDQMSQLLIEPTPGLNALVSMLQENNSREGINQLVGYLAQASFGSRQNKIPETFLIFAALYIFFSGKAEGITIPKLQEGVSNDDSDTEQRNRKRSNRKIVDYLSDKLDLPMEFFESLHTIYLKDFAQYTALILKFLRKYYQKQLQSKDIKVPIQSLVVIAESKVQNILALFSGGGQYNNIFFAKELSINQDVIELISLLSQIKFASVATSSSLSNNSSSRQRLKLYDMLSKNASVQVVLKQLKVEPNDLVTLLKLVYLDYGEFEQGTLLSDLKLVDSLNQSVMKQLLRLTTISPQHSVDHRELRKSLENMLDQCDMITQYGLDKTWLKVAFYLIQGDFLLTRFLNEDLPYLSQNTQFTNYEDNKNYLRIIEALVGFMSFRPQNIAPTTFFRNEYRRLLKIVGNQSDQEIQEMNTSDIIVRSNTKEYALHNLINFLHLNPVWAMLFEGDFNMWQLLIQFTEQQQMQITQAGSSAAANTNTATAAASNKTEASESQQQQFMNPLLAICIVLKFLNVPTIVKEIITDVEWLENLNNVFGDYELKKKLVYPNYSPFMSQQIFKQGAQNIKQSPFLQQQQQQTAAKTSYDENIEDFTRNQGLILTKTLLQSLFESGCTKDQLKSLANNCGFNQKVLNLIFSKYSDDEIQKSLLRSYIKILCKLLQKNQCCSTKEINILIQLGNRYKTFAEVKAKVGKLYQGLAGPQAPSQYGSQLQIPLQNTPPQQQQQQQQQNSSYKRSYDHDQGNNEYQNLFTSIKQYEGDAYVRLIKKAFSAVKTFFVDPQEESVPQINNPSTNLEDYIYVKYFNQKQSTFYQMFSLASLCQLRKSYFVFQGQRGRDEEHCDSVTVELDYLMSSLEKQRFFSYQMNYFSKMRIMPIIGLSMGFLLDVDHFIQANVRGQILNQKFIIQMNQLYAKSNKQTPEGRLQLQQKILALKLVSVRNECLKNFQTACNKAEILREYKWKTLLIDARDQKAQTQEQLIKAPDNYIVNAFQSNETINMEKVIFDCPESIFFVKGYRLPPSTFDQSQAQAQQFQFNYQKDKQMEFIKAYNDFNSGRQQQQTFDQAGSNAQQQQQVICPRSGTKVEEMLEQMKSFRRLCQDRLFQAMIDTFKSNFYDSFQNTDSFFNEFFPKQSQIQSSLLFLNGLMYKNNESIGLDIINNYVDSAYSNIINSESKVLAEILSLFLDNGSEAQIITNTFGLNKEIFNIFVQISMGNRNYNEASINTLFTRLFPLQQDKVILNQICQLHKGNMKDYLNLMTFSKVLQTPQQQLSGNDGEEAATNTNTFAQQQSGLSGFQIIKKIINALITDDRHQFAKVNWESFNMMEYIQFTPNTHKNHQTILYLLWQLSCQASSLEDLKKPQIQFLNYKQLQLPQNQIQLPGANRQQLQQQQSKSKCSQQLQSFLEFFTKLIQSDFSMLCQQSTPPPVQQQQQPQQQLQQPLAQVQQQPQQIQSQTSILGSFAQIPVNQFDNNNANLSGSNNNEQIIQQFKMLELLESPQQFQNLQLLAYLQPKKLGKQFSLNRSDLLTNQIQTMKSLGLTKNWIVSDQDFQEPFINLIFGLAYDNIAKIIEALSYESENKPMIEILQSLYLWKNIGYILKDMESFNDEQIVIIMYNLKNLFTIISHNITETYEKKKSLHKRPVFTMNQAFKQQPINKVTLSSLQCLLTNEIYCKICESAQKNISQPPHYYDIMQNIQKLNSRYDAIVIKNKIDTSGYKQLAQGFELLLTGMIFVQQFQKDKFTDYLQNFFSSSFNLVNYQHKIQKNVAAQLPNAREPLSLFVQEKDFAFLEIFNHLNKLQVIIQTNKHDKQCLKLKDSQKEAVLQIINQIITAIPFKLSLQKVGSPSNSNNQNIMDNSLRILIKNIVLMLTGYNLDLIQTEQKQNTNIDKQIETFLNILDITIFRSYPGLRQLLNIEKLNQLLQSILRFNFFNNNSIKEPDFQKAVLNLLEAISGQQMTEDEDDETVQSVNQTNDNNQKGFPQKQKDIVLVKLPPNMIKAVFEITNFNYQQLFFIIKQTGQIDKHKISHSQKFVESLYINDIFTSNLVYKRSEGYDSQKQKEYKELMQRLEEGQIDSRDLFIALDNEGDKSGSISKFEFSCLSRRLGINLTMHRINEIFANIKQSSDNDEKEDELNEEEFEQSLKYLQNKNTFMSLETLGISSGLLTIALALLIVILLLLISFIFVGISAFTLGGTFGSVVNSILPMFVGAGVNESEDDADKNLDDQTIEDSVLKTKSINENDDL